MFDDLVDDEEGFADDREGFRSLDFDDYSHLDNRLQPDLLSVLDAYLDEEENKARDKSIVARIEAERQIKEDAANSSPKSPEEICSEEE